MLVKQTTLVHVRNETENSNRMCISVVVKLRVKGEVFVHKIFFDNVILGILDKQALLTHL